MLFYDLMDVEINLILSHVISSRTVIVNLLLLHDDCSIFPKLVSGWVPDCGVDGRDPGRDLLCWDHSHTHTSKLAGIIVARQMP